MNKAQSDLYSIRQVAAQLNFPTSTIRRYCNYGLVPGVKHTRSGYRIFNDEQIAWLAVILQLGNAGFTPKDLKKYAKLHHSGPATIPERKAMLATKKRQLWQELEDLQAGIDFIERQTELLEQEETER